MEEKSTTLSRSILVLIIVIALVAMSALVPASWFGIKPSKKQQTVKLDLSMIKSAQAVATDKDGDGVISWKEVVEKTLPMTDEQREELKKIPVDQKVIDQLNDPNNLTASYSKNLLLGVTAFQENKITDQNTKKAFMDQISKEEAAKIKPKSYTDLDILIAKTETKASIKLYGNTIVPLLDSVVTKDSITGNMTGILTYLQSGDTSGLSYLYKDKNRLDDMLKKLTKIEVPPSAILIHIQMLNRISTYKEVVDNLSRIESDPMRASLVIQQYIPAGRSIVEMFAKYADYFNKQNVMFTSSEAGYVFITGYTLD